MHKNTNMVKEDSVCSILEHTATDGKTYKTRFYNLDAIISVEYRVNSTRATRFRIWATNILRKHLVNGYTINEKRLKIAEHKYQELQKSLKLLGNVIGLESISGEAKGLIKYGAKRIDNNALVALTLMIATSKPQEKENMIKVILNMLA